MGMAEIVRFTWLWTGFAGAPGYTNIYARGVDPEDVGLAFNDFLAAQVSRIPNVVTIQLQPTPEVLEDTTGELTGVVDIGSTTAIDCTGPGVYSAPSGACVSWSTAGIVSGRKVRGRTFLVPLIADAYQADGSLQDATRAAMLSDANTFLTAAGGQAVIWSRPRTGVPGSSHPITAANIADRVAVLRSRRD